MGSKKGTNSNARLLTLLPGMLRGADNLRMLLYALALIIIMLFNGSNIKEGIKSLRIVREAKEKKN